MKVVLLITLLYFFSSYNAFAKDWIECQFEQLEHYTDHPDIDVKNHFKKVSFSFMREKDFWSASFFELPLDTESDLLKGITGLEQPIFEKIHRNFLKILKDGMFLYPRKSYLFNYVEPQVGSGALFYAKIDESISKDAAEDIWGIGTTVWKGRLFVGMIHILEADKKTKLDEVKNLMKDLQHACLSKV